MQVYNHYIFRRTLIATLFISFILISVTMLTQSLRFLELIVESGASTWSFWMLTFLNLPKFFEIIIPIGLATSVVFILNKMTIDSEISVLKATGFSNWHLARPLLILGIGFSLFLLLMTTWVGPLSMSKTNLLRQTLKSEFSGLLFKEGVFNDVSDGLTFYIRELGSDGELQGLIIHDSRIKSQPAITLHAKRGTLVETDTGNKIIIFDGARQDYDPKKNSLKQLSFDRYSIDLPNEEDKEETRKRKPKERTIFELLSPKDETLSKERIREFRVEAHLQIIAPFLALTYVFIAVTSILSGTINRRGQSRKIITAIGSIIFIQSLYIALSDAAGKSDIALIGCYLIVIAPIIACTYILSSRTKLKKDRS